MLMGPIIIIPLLIAVIVGVVMGTREIIKRNAAPTAQQHHWTAPTPQQPAPWSPPNPYQQPQPDDAAYAELFGLAQHVAQAGGSWQDFATQARAQGLHINRP